MLHRLDAKTQLRTRITLQAGIEYLATTSFLALLWWLGRIDGAVVLGFAAISVLNNLLFLGLIVSGVSKRFRDPSMTALQMFASCGRDLVGLVWAPEIWFLFAFNLFIALPFGSLQFGRRAFAVTWLLVSLGLGLAFGALPARLTIAFDGPADKLVLWVFLSAALARLMLFNARISDLRSKLRNKLAELDEVSRKLASLATHDELTGLHNRREFNQRLAHECRRAARDGAAFHVAIVDADYFKRINDEHGHPAGDCVLRQLGELLSRHTRDCDLVARLGGEEFGILLLGMEPADALRALERIRLGVQRHAWHERVPGASVTVSIGAAGWRHGDTGDELMQRADDALYGAKHRGRNRVEVFGRADESAAVEADDIPSDHAVSP